jgi:hypothetical protein
VNATGTFIAAPPPWGVPIRAEIFGIERLEQHAESWVAAQRTTVQLGDLVVVAFDWAEQCSSDPRDVPLLRWKYLGRE